MTPEKPESPIRFANTDLIDEKESKSLKEGLIDNIEDKGVNTQEDLKDFIEDQQTEAKMILEQKAKIYFADTKGELSPIGKRILKESKDLVDATVRSLGTLNIASIRVSCSKLSDIVGFKLEIDEHAIDQFGLNKRHVSADNRRTEGFMDYAGEKMQNGKLQVWGNMEENLRVEEMKKYDASEADIKTTTAALKKHGEVKYQQFFDRGPVLVLLPELHYDAGILTDNFDALMELKKMIAILGFEGAEGEMRQGKEVDKKSAADYKKEIRQANIMASSQAIEGVLGEEVYTLGIENEKTLRYVAEKLMAMVEKIMKAPEAQKKMTKELRQMITQKIRKIDLLRLADPSSMDKDLRDILIVYRNQLWLRRLQDAFLSPLERKSFSAHSNLVFIVCGGGHAKDLTSRAGHYGFKGVLNFMPNSMNEVLDPKTIRAYLDKQLGVKIK